MDEIKKYLLPPFLWGLLFALGIVIESCSGGAPAGYAYGIVWIPIAILIAAAGGSLGAITVSELLSDTMEGNILSAIAPRMGYSSPEAVATRSNLTPAQAMLVLGEYHRGVQSGDYTPFAQMKMPSSDYTRVVNAVSDKIFKKHSSPWNLRTSSILTALRHLKPTDSDFYDYINGNISQAELESASVRSRVAKKIGFNDSDDEESPLESVSKTAKYVAITAGVIGGLVLLSKASSLLAGLRSAPRRNPSAEKIFESFNGHPVDATYKVDYPDDEQQELAALGRVSAIEYLAENYDGKYYRHPYPENDMPLMVGHEDGSTITILGPDHKITNRGIVSPGD